jgi:hypothetical protein
MEQNGKHSASRVRLASTKPAPDPQEAVAITAAIEQFLRDTKPQPSKQEATVSPWMRRGLLEGAGLCSCLSSAWGDPHAWGR